LAGPKSTTRPVPSIACSLTKELNSFINSSSLKLPAVLLKLNITPLDA